MSAPVWNTVIGLEVHARLPTASKLFSSAATAFGADPNTQVSPVDAGMPGMLPVLNRDCVRLAIRTALALDATINPVSVFARKNYCYPDLPQGYQISQYDQPVIGRGVLTVPLDDGSEKEVRIVRIHLEQDAGKLVHDLIPGRSCIDLNRSGVPLMELVTEPDLASPDEAVAFVRTLRAILRTIGTCDGHMQEGSLRTDVNVSLHRPGTPLGTRTEIKNLNSFRFIRQAITVEAARQQQLLEQGGTIVQETRLFDPERNQTRAMRDKEDAHDYRYFPDPDLPVLVISPEMIAAERDRLPELPTDRRKRLIREHDLRPADATVLVGHDGLADLFETLVHPADAPPRDGRTVANRLLGEVASALRKEGHSLADMNLPPSGLGRLFDLMDAGTLSGRMAREVLAAMLTTGRDPDDIVREQNLGQITDTDVLASELQRLMAAHPDQLAAFRAGKDKIRGWFIGQVMKATGGQADPVALDALARRMLATPGENTQP